MILYLSNRLVQAVEMKDKNTALICQELAPEGSIINGIVTDEEVFLPFIKNFFSRNKLPRKECTLVVNSTQLNSRVLELPRVSGQELRRMIEREFADSRTEQTVFAYHVLEVLPSGKMQRILAVSAERGFLEHYLVLFEQAGVEITSVEPALSVFVKRFMASPDIQKKNCVVQILDGQEIISILFVKGIYLYSQRNRIFSEDDSDLLAKEAGAVVDRLLQFATSQHVEDPISTLYLCGQNQAGLKTVIEENGGFNQQIFPKIYKEEKLRVKKRSRSTGLSDFVYPLEGNGKKEKNLDFILQLKKNSEKNRKKKTRMTLVLPAAAVLAVCLVITGILSFGYFNRISEIERLQRMMQLPDSVDGRISYELADTNIVSMESEMMEARQVWEKLMSYPTLTSGAAQKIQECAGEGVSAKISSFNRDSGVLSLEASATDVKSISSFIKGLQEQEMFETVEYSGYTKLPGEETYSIHVVCVMAEGAGR